MIDLDFTLRLPYHLLYEEVNQKTVTDYLKELEDTINHIKENSFDNRHIFYVNPKMEKDILDALHVEIDFCKFYLELNERQSSEASLGKWIFTKKENPFQVTFHPNRLSEPLQVKKPSKIFVCSMGEMYDHNSKYGWLELIFGVMRRCPQHIFQSLTKQPDSAIPELPENLWHGVSVTGKNDEWRIRRLKEVEAKVHFISFEPLLGEVDFDNYSVKDVEWVIVGKLTGRKQQDFDMGWVMEISAECSRYNIPIFMKDNLGLKNPRQEFPEGESCGGRVK